MGHDVGRRQWVRHVPLHSHCAGACREGQAGTGARRAGQAEAATRLRHLVDEALHARLVQVIVVGVVHMKPEDGG